MTGPVGEDLERQVVEWRRHLHRHPEPSFEERDTAAFVAETLAGFGDGLTIERPTETSVVARLAGGRPGRVVALRADIDALRVEEESGVDFASERPGAMHACGHDGHTAMLLGAASVLAGSELPGGEVRFLFQHAEETAPGGARDLVAAGVLDGVDLIYGCHLWAPLGRARRGGRAGPFMAASDFFRLTIPGLGGHAGLPHDATDPIAIAAQVVTNLQHVVARRTDPLRSAVLTIAMFHAGDAPHVIPAKAELSGTVRTFDPELRDRMPRLIEEIAGGVARAHGADAALDYEFAYRAVVNDAGVAELVRSVAEPGTLTEIDPVMGGDDFSAYLAEVPGCYAFIGAGSEEAGATYMHRHPRFRIDERALATGVRLHVDVARRALLQEAR